VYTLGLTSDAGYAVVPVDLSSVTVVVRSCDGSCCRTTTLTARITTTLRSDTEGFRHWKFRCAGAQDAQHNRSGTRNQPSTRSRTLPPESLRRFWPEACGGQLSKPKSTRGPLSHSRPARRCHTQLEHSRPLSHPTPARRRPLSHGTGCPHHTEHVSTSPDEGQPCCALKWARRRGRGARRALQQTPVESNHGIASPLDGSVSMAGLGSATAAAAARASAPERPVPAHMESARARRARGAACRKAARRERMVQWEVNTIGTARGPLRQE